MKNPFTIATILLTSLLLIYGVALAEVWTETNFRDFADGVFSDGGANIYVTKDGSLRLIGQQWDLNGDGWMDIVFSNRHDGSSENIHSYIYWGAEDGFSPANRTALPTYNCMATLAYVSVSQSPKKS